MPAKLPPAPDPKSLIFRKTLSVPGLLKIVRGCFNQVSEHRRKESSYSLTDVLMSGLAVFSLKCPSLLDFDKQRQEERVRHNLHHLYGVKQAPCDTKVDPRVKTKKQLV